MSVVNAPRDAWQCWSCGIICAGSLDECPRQLLGCGAPRQYEDELALIAEVEHHLRETIAKLAHLANTAKRDGVLPLRQQTLVVMTATANAATDAGKLRAALSRNGKRAA